MSEATAPDPFLDPDWLLAGFDVSADRYQFARVTRQTYADSVFLDHRIRPRPAETVSLTGAQVDAALLHSRVKQSAWIFHTGFCGSTLLASCLDHPGFTLVLREPLVLSRLAHALRGNAPRSLARNGSADEAGPGNSARVLTDRVIGLCERSYAGEALLVKPSNFANKLLGPVMGAVPFAAQRKAVLMSCSLESLLVSILKKRSEAESLLPGFVTALLQDSDYLAESGLPGTEGLDLLQLAVVFWHCQRHFLQQQSGLVNSSKMLKLGMERFLAEPLQVLAEVSAFLDLRLPAETLQETVESGAFRRHSKQAHAEYSPGEYHREQQVTRDRHAVEIDAAMAWAAPLLARLPVEPFEEAGPAA
jgi:hypothetical protein